MRSSANQVVIDVVCAFEVIACKYPGSTRVSTGAKLDKLCAVYANQGWSYCILPYLRSNCICTTCGDKFIKHKI